MKFAIIHNSFQEVKYMLDSSRAYLKLRETWIDRNLPISVVEDRLKLWKITDEQIGGSLHEALYNMYIGGISETLKGRMDLEDVIIHIQIVRQS